MSTLTFALKIYDLITNEADLHFDSNNQTGMTMVELLVVIAILGIIAGVTGLNLVKYGPTYELRANARTFYAEMQNAKVRTIRTGTPWGIVCDEAASTCAIYSSSGPDNDFTTAGDNTLYKTIDLTNSKHGIVIGHGAATTRVGGGAIGAENVTYAADTLAFNARGTSDEGEIYIQNNQNESYAIGTNRFGNIFLRRWNGGGWN